MGVLQRVFRFGQLPPELAAARDGGAALFVAEGITVKTGGKLKTPVRSSSSFTSLHGGALVITADRVLASYGRHVIVDDALADLEPGGPTQVVLDATGLHLTVDIARVVEGGTGHVDVEVRAAVPADVLAALPTREWSGWFARPDPLRALRRI